MNELSWPVRVVDSSSGEYREGWGCFFRHATFAVNAVTIFCAECAITLCPRCCIDMLSIRKDGKSLALSQDRIVPVSRETGRRVIFAPRESLEKLFQPSPPPAPVPPVLQLACRCACLPTGPYNDERDNKEGYQISWSVQDVGAWIEK